MIISDDTLLQIELDNLTRILIARDYPLEIITRNIEKALQFSHYELIHRNKQNDSKKQVLPVITPYSNEGIALSSTIKYHWPLIKNDPDLSQIWPSPPITAFTKSKSLKDILVHSRQGHPLPIDPQH